MMSLSRALVFALFCAVVIVAVVSAASFAEDKAAKKDYGLRSAILKRAKRLMKPRTESNSKQATSVSRQDEYPQFPDYNYEPDPNALDPTHKDDQIERVGIISGKAILKVIGISFLVLLVGGAVFLIPLFPCLILLLILYNLPIVKLIDVAPTTDPTALARSLPNLLEFDDGCIERISCGLGKRSGSYGKLLLHWLQRRFTTNNPWVKRISRGFEQQDNCDAHLCSNALIKRIL